MSSAAAPSAGGAAPSPLPLFVLRSHRAPVHALAFHVAPQRALSRRSHSSGVVGRDGTTARMNLPPSASTSASHVMAASSALASVPPAACSSLSSVAPTAAPSAAAPAALLLSGDSTGVVHAWDLSTRRSVVTLQAHPGHPVLALASLQDGRVITQGKDGTVKLWDLSSPSTPLRTFETHSYSFCRMAVTEATGSPLLLLPQEEASTLVLVDLRQPGEGIVQRIECEKRIPRDESLEEQLTARMSDEEAEQLRDMLAQRPPQYERKVGIVMAAKFIDVHSNQQRAPASTHATEQPSAASSVPSGTSASSFASSSSASAASSLSSSPSSSLPPLQVAWASEGGFLGVWDIRAGRHVMQQHLHKDTILSMDLSWNGAFGAAVSSSQNIHAFSLVATPSAPATAASAPGASAATGGDDELVVHYQPLGSISLPHEGLAEVSLRDDVRLFATAGWDRRVRLFDAHFLQPLAVLREHAETVQCVAMCPSGQGLSARLGVGSGGHSVGSGARALNPAAVVQSGLLASGSKDGKVALYQVYPDGQTQITDARSSSASASPSVPLLKHEALFARLHAALPEST